MAVKSNEERLNNVLTTAIIKKPVDPTKLDSTALADQAGELTRSIFASILHEFNISFALVVDKSHQLDGLSAITMHQTH